MSRAKNYIDDIEQLYARAEENEHGCLEWKGNKDKDGYGRIKINYIQTPVHRLVARLAYGEPSENEIALHSCDNPPCILAEHLRWGSFSDNALDRKNRGRANNFRKVPIEKYEEIQKLYEDGLTQREIGKVFNVSDTRISQILRRNSEFE